jgi:hypothetical protein
VRIVFWRIVYGCNCILILGTSEMVTARVEEVSSLSDSDSGDSIDEDENEEGGEGKAADGESKGGDGFPGLFLTY